MPKTEDIPKPNVMGQTQDWPHIQPEIRGGRSNLRVCILVRGASDPKKRKFSLMVV